nr:retrovirus-related Pol polyprotein from transposon TNT 1-94 [Tanacetum cinerariifolium]
MQTQTSNALHNAIMEAGSKDHPPMLAPGNYVKWKSRIKRYINTKHNHELIHYCLKNPPYKYTWVDKEALVTEGSSVTTTKRYTEKCKNVSQDIRDQLNAEAKAVQIILTGIDNDIYSTVDAYPNACEMWKAIEKWKRFVTLVKQSQELKTVSYHKLYDILKQHHNEVNEIRAEILAPRECQKPKWEKDAAYHKEKMLLCKQEEAGFQLNAEQADWKDDTDDETEDQELEAHYMYMAKLQEESISVNDTYPIEQDEHNVIIDSLDMSYDTEQIDQDDADDLDNKRDLLASLIEKLKCEIDDSKNRNKFLETLNKALVNKLKDKEIDKVIDLENKVKVLDNIVYKTDQSVQTMNMLNRNCKMSFAKPKFLKKAQRANPRLYNIGCYNDNLALMLTPESDEVIRLEKESRSKLSNLIRPFDYEKLNNLYDLFVPQREKSSVQRYFPERINAGLEQFYLCLKEDMVADLRYFNSLKLEVDSLRFQLETQKTQFLNEIDQLSKEYYYADHMNAILACNDSLKAKSLNVNFVCVTCGKCVLNDNHDMCALHYRNDVNSRTKMPMAMPISTRETKRIVNQSVAKPLRRTVTSESTNQKPRRTIRKLYEHVSSRGTDLYSITLQDTSSPNPIFLMAKATSSQAWLWHHRLSHLNFNTINLLSKNDIVIGLPKLKFVKDHLCSSCDVRKAK